MNNLLDYRLTNKEELIKSVYEKNHPQYFPKKLLRFSDQEVFIDAGAYDGGSTINFIKRVNDKYKKIWMMEPDPLMYVITREIANLRRIRNVEIVNAGAYSHSCSLSFTMDNAIASSRIDEKGDFVIEATSIDEMLKGEEATYIKMDIEGAEREALIGADATITEYHPKLAISIYHRDDDLWQIPYYLMNKYSNYKYYIRHYTYITTETILYAQPQ